MTQIEISELYAKAKGIIKNMPNKEIRVSKYGVIQPSVWDDKDGQLVDFVQLTNKKKLEFLHLCYVDGEAWVAHMSHLPANLRQEILQRVVEEYETLGENI